MPEHSAGVLLYRARGGHYEVFLVHPGGPYWAAKDEGAWSIPKGLVQAGEDELMAARREFTEETGFAAGGAGTERDLGVYRLPSGKRLHVWAIAGDCDVSRLASNLFELEWPPRSGLTQRFPEVDRGGWFAHAQALTKLTRGQHPILERFFADLPKAAGSLDVHPDGGA
jgi:predicted NUDIX family NTP pyrophosphohydrolase